MPNSAPKACAPASLREATATSCAPGASRKPSAIARAILPVPRMPQRTVFSMLLISFCASCLALRAEHRRVIVKIVVLALAPAGQAQHGQRREVRRGETLLPQVLRHPLVEPGAACHK